MEVPRLLILQHQYPGNNIPVSVTGYSISGADAGNYLLIQPSGLTGNIIGSGSIVVTISGVTASGKVYDGTTTANINTSGVTLVGVVSPDNVTLNTSGATGTFNNKDVGTGKPVTTSGFVLEGPDAAKYTLVQPVLSADITPKAIVVTANDLSKDYGTLLTFSGTEFTSIGLIPGDIISGLTISSTGSPAGANAGTYSILIGGGSDGNYTFSYVSGALTVNKVELIATADNKTRNYGAINPTLTITYTGFVNGDNSSVVTDPAINTTAVTTSDVGLYPITVSGGSAVNYDLTYVDGILTVTKAQITVIADNKSRVYNDQNPLFTITYQGFVNGEDASVLDVLPEATTYCDADYLTPAFMILM